MAPKFSSKDAYYFFRKYDKKKITLKFDIASNAYPSSLKNSWTRTFKTYHIAPKTDELKPERIISLISYLFAYS